MPHLRSTKIEYDIQEKVTTESYPLWSLRSVRLRIVLLVCLALIVQGMMKVNLSMALICMVDHDSHVNHAVSTNNTADPRCPRNHATSQHYNTGHLKWSNEQQTRVLAAFYWGGLLSVLVLSWLAGRLGEPSKVLLTGVVVNIIGTFLTPVVALQIGPNGLMVLRFVMGMGQGVLLPTAAAVIAPWFPVTEKSTACALYTAGNQISAIMAMFLSSTLCQTTFLNGWPAIFYSFGTVSVLFCALWISVISDTPQQHPSISTQELRYIVGNQKIKPPKLISTPWLAMFTSTVVWAMILCTCAQAFITVSLNTFLPKYFHAVLKKDIGHNGMLSALPFLVQLISKWFFGAIADHMKVATNGSPRMLDAVTKFFNSIASFGAAICIFCVGYLDCTQQTMAIVLLCTANGALSGYIPGYYTSLVSVAPAHTTSVTSLTRIGGQLFSAASPMIVGLLTAENTLAEWRLVFSIISVVLLFSGIFFEIFGSAQAQAWDVGDEMHHRCSVKLNNAEAKFHVEEQRLL